MPIDVVEFVKMAGVGGLMFLIFYLYHKSSSEQMNKIITQTFDMLKLMIEQNTMQLGLLQKIDTEIKSNVWCPYVREKNGMKGKDNG